MAQLANSESKDARKVEEQYDCRETYFRSQESGENVANLIDFCDDPIFGLVGCDLVLNPNSKEEAD
jgi:hypothetical protein